ncbi:DUF2897 family protein [Pseudoalteromonas marina]|nr:DUF2897 family protein [Pseudoalteromonas marina]MDP2487205.1 DUF2897 family protein [Pseudoalteromonas marina]
MQTWQVILIVVMVFGVVIGNIALIKHSANMKFKKSDSYLKNKQDTKKP